MRSDREGAWADGGAIATAGSHRELVIASSAAAIATAGDLLMLLVANSLRPELGLPRPPEAALPVGGILGVAAIPLYALGYRAVARAISSSPGRSRIVLACGSAGALVGALIHGLTAFAIRGSLASGAAPGSPVEAVAASGGFLPAAWLFASLLVLAASIAVFRAGTSRPGGLPRKLAWLNPAAVTLALGVAGLPWEWGRSFLLPAAPNLAHVVFFCSAIHALGRRPPAARAPGRRPSRGRGPI